MVSQLVKIRTGETIDTPVLYSEKLNNYTTRIVETGNYTYIGFAKIGSSSASAVWQIRLIDETSGTIIKWADGDSNFDNIWDNYASLSYS